MTTNYNIYAEVRAISRYSITAEGYADEWESDYETDKSEIEWYCVENQEGELIDTFKTFDEAQAFVKTLTN